MSPSENHERFPEDLQEVADILRDQRSALTPLELDQIKLRAMSSSRRSTPSQQKGFAMRSRLVTFLTVGALAVGSGTAVAGFEGGGGDGNFGGGDDAGHHEYKPPCKADEKVGEDHKCQKDDKGDQEQKGDRGERADSDQHGD